MNDCLQSTYIRPNRPPRMRTACNACHAAKLKCSGEKTGCKRCLNLNLECCFELSMVGRASKVRKSSEKKACNITSKTMEAMMSTQQQLQQQEEQPQKQQEITSAIAGLPTEFDTMDRIRPFIPREGQVLNEHLSMLLPGDQLDFNWENFQMISAQSPPIMFQIPSTSAPLSSTDSSSISNNHLTPEERFGIPANIPYMHVSELCTLIRTFESLTQESGTENLSVDIILKETRNATRNIEKIVRKPEFKLCKSCPLMVATIIDMAVSLFEYGSRKMKSLNFTSTQSDSDGSALGDSAIALAPSDISKFTERPNITFGELELESDESQELISLLLTRETTRIKKLIAFVSVDVKNCPKVPLSQVSMITRWYVDMDSRISNLTTSVESG